jgi:hypothetical protein
VQSRAVTPEAPPSAAANSAGSLLPPFVSPRGLTLCAAGALVAAALVAWLSAGVHLAYLLQLRLQLSGGVVEPQQIQTVESTLWIGKIARTVVFGVAALAFLAWLFRLRVNVRAFGVRKLDFARHWSVLGFLVPALNFVRPYQVMAEVWRASEPSVLDPFDWKSNEPPRLLTLWWGIFVIAATLQLVAFGLGQTAGLVAFKSLVASGFAVAADAATAVSASLAYFFVTRLAAAQTAKHRRLRGGGEDA